MLLQLLIFDFNVLNIRIWDILDVLIVAYLMFVIYRLLRGTLAFNIFVGVVLLYIVWWLVKMLEMNLLSLLLGRFVAFGVIILIIIFQPEVRRFLLLLGDTTLKGRFGFFKRWFNTSASSEGELLDKSVDELANTLNWLSEKRYGALIVLSGDEPLPNFANNGIQINANLNDLLLRSIFLKSSPLHDGAVIINKDRIVSTSVVLPLSQNIKLPKDLGLRHRAAVGVTEQHNVVCFVVSEESGEISFAKKGKIESVIQEQRIKILLKENILRPSI